MLTRLKAKGLRICVWINPYIAQRSALFEEGRAKGYLVHQGRRHRLAVGQVAGWNGARRLHQSRCGAMVFLAPRAAARPRGGLRSKPISASESRRTSPGTTGPIRTGCTTTTRTCTTAPCSTCWNGGGGPARRCCSPGQPPRAASSTRCTGAATAIPPTNRWPRRCVAGCPWLPAVSATGRTTSAGSRARPTRGCSSAGSPSVCCPATAGCTVRTRTGCRGRSTRKPSISPGSSPG